MFHHLPLQEKTPMLREVWRVLKPGGTLHLLDFGGPEGHEHSLSNVLHRNHRLEDNNEDRIKTMMSHAALAEAKVRERAKVMAGLGRIVYFEASRA